MTVCSPSDRDSCHNTHLIRVPWHDDRGPLSRKGGRKGCLVEARVRGYARLSGAIPSREC